MIEARFALLRSKNSSDAHKSTRLVIPRCPRAISSRPSTARGPCRAQRLQGAFGNRQHAV